MKYGSTGNNQLITQIIEVYFRVSETPSDKLNTLADNLTELILQAFPNELKSADAFNLPYKDITDVVFSSEQVLRSDSIHGFREYILHSIDKKFDQSNPDKHHNTKKKYIKRFMHIYDKLVEHTFLAQAQRDFIKHSIDDAIKTQETKWHDIQNLAKNTKKTADKAKKTADKAEETYKSMFANYVTILGVFTAIIVTIFGGLNVIDGITKQQDVQFSAIVFLASLSLMCVVCLLYFLANLIMHITERGKTRLSCLFSAIVVVCVVIMFVSWHLNDARKINTPTPTQSSTISYAQ